MLSKRVVTICGLEQILQDISGMVSPSVKQQLGLAVIGQSVLLSTSIMFLMEIRCGLVQTSAYASMICPGTSMTVSMSTMVCQIGRHMWLVPTVQLSMAERFLA